jgi:ABC-type transport system involved in cytochrome bd biosynthesis fused ATPase/permease subunit
LAILSSLLVAGLVGRQMMNTGAVALKRARTRKRESAERLGAAMASAVSLKAERVWDDESSAATSALRIADLEILSLRRLQARFDAIASLFGPVAGFSVIATAWTVGDRGQSLLAPIFLAFAWLALGESIIGASRILIAKLRRSAARTEIDKWTKGAERLAQTEALKAQPRELRHEHLQRISPSGTPISKRPLALHLRAGSPTVLVGASGAGKTSLLKQIAGWIGNDEISSQEEILSPEQRGALTTLVLHDAAILDDTVRSNLFALGYSDAVIWAALKSVEIDERVRAAGGLDAWITQDKLSLGEAQRLNLARAWLASNPIVLLDEPMEHLDTTQGQRILRRLTDHLRDRIVVISTHRPTSLHNGAMVDLHP